MESNLRKIDVHNHFYPEAYIEEIGRRSAAAGITTNEAGETLIEYAGDYSVIVPVHRDPALRLDDLDRAEIDMQILSLTVPGVHFEPVNRGVELARVTNDAFGEIIREYPDRYSAFATLPVQAPEAAARELNRAVNELGLAGAMIFSNHAGVPLDNPSIWPVYEAAEALDVPLLIHPIGPASLENMTDYRLVALLGFPFDMTLAATRLVLSGTMDRFPKLQLILSQLGGALPMLAERVERGFEIYPELAGSLERSPSEYFQNMYYDTVPYGELGIPLTYQFAGADRIVLASDHPHQIGNLDECTQIIETMAIPEVDKAKMLGGNIARLLKLSES